MTDQLNFEQALAELQAVVERLQKPDVPLEDALKLYKRGTELAQRSETLLVQAELQVQQLSQAVKEHVGEYSTDGGLDEVPSTS